MLLSGVVCWMQIGIGRTEESTTKRGDFTICCLHLNVTMNSKLDVLRSRVLNLKKYLIFLIEILSCFNIILCINKSTNYQVQHCWNSQWVLASKREDAKKTRTARSTRASSKGTFDYITTTSGKRVGIARTMQKGKRISYKVNRGLDLRVG